MIRRNSRLRGRVVRFSKGIIPESAVKKRKSILKTTKQALRKKKLNMEFENKMVKQARAALKTHTLNLFIGNQIEEIVVEIKKSQDQIIEFYDIRFETEA